MIASLPMYDWPALQPAHDAFWALVRDGLRMRGQPAPDQLDRNRDLWDVWRSPDLVLGQTCGLPYRQVLHGKVRIVATLDYGLPDADAGYYYSHLIAHRNSTGTLADFVDSVLAYNGPDSQSGWAAPQNEAAKLGFQFARTLHTGAHGDSARAVAQGRADIAAIDAVTWRIICATQPEVASQLRVIAHTTPTPGLPLITALQNDPALLGEIVEKAIADLTPTHRVQLGLRGLVRISAADYLAVTTPKPPTTPAQDT